MEDADVLSVFKLNGMPRKVGRMRVAVFGECMGCHHKAGQLLADLKERWMKVSNLDFAACDSSATVWRKATRF